MQYAGYVTDLITTFTKQWLQTREEDQPFFLMMNHKAPHRNWVPAERHYNLYEDVTFPLPATYFDDYEGRFAAAHQEMNIYRDMYEGHDLKMVTGVDSDTLLYDPWPHAFLGTMTAGEQKRFFAAYRERNNAFHTTPMTEKEIAEWKYQRYLQDYLATIRAVDESVGQLLDFCGIAIPDDMQGESFRELTETGRTPDGWRKSLYYHYYEYPGFHSVRAHCGVKTERYKLIHFYGEQIWELYDLQNDPHEIHNLYGKRGTEQITRELKQELKRLQAQYELPEDHLQPGKNENHDETNLHNPSADPAVSAPASLLQPQPEG